MAHFDHGTVYSQIAEATVNNHRLVKMGTAQGTVIQAAAVGDEAIGAVHYGGSAGQAVGVILDGVAKIECGGNITLGAKVTSDGVGRAVAAVATNKVMGKALSAGASGEIIEVLLTTPSIVAMA